VPSSKLVRLLGPLALAVSALVIAAPAAALYAPQLGVTTAAGSSTVTFLQSAIDAPTAKLVLSVPAGYTLGGGAAGTVLGHASAAAQSSDLGGSDVELSGTITVAAPNASVQFGGAATTVAAAAQSCTGTAAHDGYWLLQLAGGGNVLAIPIAVDAVPAASADTAGPTLTLCLPAPDVPFGAGNRAPAGDKLTRLTLELSGLSTPTTGWHLWLVRSTSYTPGLGTVGTTVEAEAFDRTPAAITLQARRSSGRVAVSGRLSAGGNGKLLAGQTVLVSAGARKLATLRTGSGGSYHARITVPPGTASLTATASVPLRQYAGACSTADGTACTSLSWGGFSVASKPAAIG
jgi:hypothetical protein